jgi:type IV secretion system protein VirB1
MDLLPAIEQCALNIEPIAIIALMKQESNFKPYQIGINHSSKTLKQQPQSYHEAVTWSKKLIQSGHNIDMGLMQINSANLKKLSLSVEQVFEPCTNLKAGAQILLENYQRAAYRYGHGEKAFQSALSAYNTGNFQKGFRNGYVYKVMKHLKQTGKFASSPERPKNKKIAATLPTPKSIKKHYKTLSELSIERRLRKTYQAPKPISK